MRIQVINTKKNYIFKKIWVEFSVNSRVVYTHSIIAKEWIIIEPLTLKTFILQSFNHKYISEIAFM